MNYRQAIDYLLTFTDFESSGHFTDRPDIEPMRSLLGRLGDPHVGRLTVHVAGSKGKGSVSAMIESILRASGQTTGLYTSPHLHDYTERIQINGDAISRNAFARLLTEIQPAIEAERRSLGERKLITFDLLTALGFVAFRDAGVTAQVIEVGLGGRLDSTNVFGTKHVAVITPLSFEHTAILGDTIEEIAAEKAAIITPACVAVLAPQQFREAAEVVRDRAASVGSMVVDVVAEYRWCVVTHDVAGQTVRIERGGEAIEVQIPLLGAFQAENAATAVAVACALGVRAGALTHKGGGDITVDAIVRGLATVRWPGRLEVLQESPLVIADGAHNAASARRLREALVEYFDADDVLFVVGSGSDKDIDGLAAELAPVAARVIATRSQHPRAMQPALVAAAFERAGVSGEDVDSVAVALDIALAASDDRAVICVTGSLFVAAEGREYFGSELTSQLEA